MKMIDFEAMLAELVEQYKDIDANVPPIEDEPIETIDDLIAVCGYGRDYMDTHYDAYNGCAYD